MEASLEPLVVQRTFIKIKSILAGGVLTSCLFSSFFACTSERPEKEGPASNVTQKTGVKGRLIILGFDGVDPRRVDALITKGRLPHIEAMAQKGHRGALQTTNPPQSPVAWAAFATGKPAGEHGVFDFIGRYVRNYFPKIATTKIHHAEQVGGVMLPATAENLRRGASFWDVIARAGHKTLVLSVPYAYPPPKDGARALSGLGAPDVRGTNSTFTLLSADEKKVNVDPPAGGVLALLEKGGFGIWNGTLSGPRIKVEGHKGRVTLAAPVIIRLSKTVEKALEIEISGQKISLGPKNRSAYIEVQFTAAGVKPVWGSTRITYRKGAPKPELFFEPTSLLPRAPYLPISEPPELALDLWRDHGPFKTVGWVHDTSALGGSFISEAEFLSDAQATMQRRADMTYAAMKKGSDVLFLSVFTAPDRIGHMFYRYIDKKHKAPTPGDKKRLANSLDEAYIWMDDIVGKVQGLLRPADTLLVMSDHGFGSYRRGFNINRWLLQKGYLVLKPGYKESTRLFEGVLWKKTRAYAMGTGSIYLNIQGREGEGIVQPAAAPALARKIARELKGLKDGKVIAVKDVFIGDEIYKGPMRKDAPDLRVALALGYRASWATALGGVPQGLFNNNSKKWSGDHSSNHPADVPGFILVSRPIKKSQPRIEDIAATAYQYFSVDAPTGMVGKPLF